MNTHDTTVQVHGVLQCAENQNCTCTHDTCFGFTMGLTIPMFNPRSASEHVQGDHKHS